MTNSRTVRTVQRILDSYRQDEAVNYLDGKNLPTRETVAGIAQELIQLMFPGFHNRVPIRSAEVPNFVKRAVSSIGRQLRYEIEKVLSFEVRLRNRSKSSSETAHRAATITDRFLIQLPDVRRKLASDVQAAYEGDPAATSADEVILAYPGLEAITIQRIAHLLYQEHVLMIPRLMTEWAHSRTGIDIHPGAQIASHFFIDHGTGVVIGETTVIGSHVKIYQGVTLGAKSFAKDAKGRIVKGIKRHPNVGNHVTIYSNATILGGDTSIGDGSTIAANVFLTRSVPSNSLVYYEEAELKIVPKQQKPAASASRRPKI
jgi:serine O-acetyltransferase